MFYSIIGRDHPDSLTKRRAARPAHLARLNDLQAAGRVLLAGPLSRHRLPRPWARRLYRQPDRGGI